MVLTDNVFYMNRKNIIHGGVALYVHHNLNSVEVEKMSMAVDDIMECITVEIAMEKTKNLQISCIYRSPGTDINIFTDHLTEMYSNNNKNIFICGDFNIDLLKVHAHKPSELFLNSMYSMMFYPKITRPTRITSHSSTLIDNIFTNVIDNKVESGIIINDISDHLPVFALVDVTCEKNLNVLKTTTKRLITVERINALKQSLVEQDWDFVSKQQKIYSPWITKGLENACKKKNTLYRKFLRNRSPRNELNLFFFLIFNSNIAH